MYKIIDKLFETHNLDDNEILSLVQNNDKDILAYLCQKADCVRKEVYGKDVFIRGLIEISNICKNNCLYCGIRGENKNCERYRLTKEEIIQCVKENYPAGFRTFVLQGGEDNYYTDDVLCEIITEIKENYSCAITLSLGERTKESYQKLYECGADRYLLRHETANKEHYKKLHPENMSYDNRIKCLNDLKAIGYQVGCGFMVGSPYQTPENLVEDLRFIKNFNPEMCGIGPFIPHQSTPFKDFQTGTLELTIKMLALVRLLVPDVLLPATTALATISENGRELGLKAGANVIMPNLLTKNIAEKYSLYNNKFYEESDTKKLKQELEQIGYNLVISRGDNIRSVTEKKNLHPLLGGGQGGGNYPYKKLLLQNARNLRKNATKQERKMWSILRNHQFYGLEFKRQCIIDNYIVDFICKSKKLIIELDGGQHNELKNIINDNERTKFLEAIGYKVIRIWNNDIDKNLQGVYKKLMDVCGIDKPPPQPSPEERELR